MIAIIRAIKTLDRASFRTLVGNLRSAKLHARGQFIRLHTGAQFALAGIPFLMPFVLETKEFPRPRFLSAGHAVREL